MNRMINLEQIKKEVYETEKKVYDQILEPSGSTSKHTFFFKDVSRIIDLTIDQMKFHLILHDTLKFVGFGKFMVITKHNLKARSPKTGENAFLPVHTRVVFKSSFFRSWFKDHPVLEDMDAKESKEEPQ